jgi:flavin reductase (DIM6/NTAB) family NADH-FMN oxidoreductase RutF
MVKKTGNIEKFYQYAFPMQAAILTCTDKNGKTNPITVAWHTPISKKPALYGVSIAPSRHSYKLIKESKEFVINFAPYKLVEKIHFCGTKSGRNTDKIKETGLTLSKSKKIKTKIIKECYANLECKLYRSVKLGDHTFFVGEVVNTQIDENAFEKDILYNKKVEPCYYLGSNTYTAIGSIRKQF